MQDQELADWATDCRSRVSTDAKLEAAYLTCYERMVKAEGSMLYCQPSWPHGRASEPEEVER